MDHRIFQNPWLGWFFRLCKAIPIAPQKEDPQAYEQAFARARQVLAEGDVLCLFPEGAITRDGQMAPFKGGIMKILETHPVPVVPAALHNLWGSYFSRIDGAAMSKPFRRETLLSVGVGLLVFGLWIHLDHPWLTVGEVTASFRPVDAEGQLQWDLIAVRWVGAALMVPVMEELFWRSFLMRWIDNPDFQQVSPRTVSFKALALSTLAFATAHTLWLAAIVAGLAYAWLYQRTGKLWAPIVAHAVTNGVLGVWVVITGNWQFW
ncbi:unnamed protein product [Victoria cruziana]